MSKTRANFIDETVAELVLQELTSRRQEAYVALANVYLRGTVLFASAVAESGLVASMPICPTLKAILLIVLCATTLISMWSFWPFKVAKFRIDVIRRFLVKQGVHANKAFQNNLQKEYEQIESVVAKRNVVVKWGFFLLSLALMAAIIFSAGGTK